MIKKLRVAAYARVSTDKDDQANSLDNQRNYFTDYITQHEGWQLVNVFYDEGISGTQTKKRKGFMEMIAEAEAGEIDLIITKEVSRFARNTKDLLDLVEKLHIKEVEFVSKKEAIDTTTPTGKFMLTIFGAVAELEREYILQRQREGIEIAKEQGKYKGRKKKVYTDFDTVVQKWRNKKITTAQAMKELGMSKSTFYRRVK